MYILVMDRCYWLAPSNECRNNGNCTADSTLSYVQQAALYEGDNTTYKVLGIKVNKGRIFPTRFVSFLFPIMLKESYSIERIVTLAVSSKNESLQVHYLFGPI
jgi:hypothetical protein